MLKQSEQQNVNDPLDEEFSAMDVLDDANSMFMVRSKKHRKKHELQQSHVCLYCGTTEFVYDQKHNFQPSGTSLASCIPRWFLTCCSNIQLQGMRYVQVVGFEVMACSIKRKAGARVEPLSCVGNDDRPPEPQEVTAGNQMATAHAMATICCKDTNHLYCYDVSLC